MISLPAVEIQTAGNEANKGGLNVCQARETAVFMRLQFFSLLTRKKHTNSKEPECEENPVSTLKISLLSCNYAFKGMLL